MKFEDLLMQPSEGSKQKIKDLEEEVEKLQQDLEGELLLKSALQCAMQGPSIHSCPCLSSLVLPSQVQQLLQQVAMAEEEIMCLERRVYGLKLNLYQEHKRNKEWEMLYFKELQPQLGKSRKKQSVPKPKNPTGSGQHRKHKIFRQRTATGSSGSSTEISSLSFPRSFEEITEVPRYSRSFENDVKLETEIDVERPNRLSEELVKCLIGIFLKLHQKPFETQAESSIVPMRSSSILKSKSFTSKTSVTCTVPPLSLDKNAWPCIDPYDIMLDLDGRVRDTRPYKTCLQITLTSIHKQHLSNCLLALKKLRDLLHELGNVDLTSLNYKQKLAFWINIFNASIMHAFLRLGFPSAQDKPLEFMNETAINIGGVMLNASAIEHFILRHPSEYEWGIPDEMEMHLRRTYGLEYPEPNVTFALCRGSWSSPALRVYKPAEVVNQLEKAKLEYLEGSIVITSKKKILLPKLMQWHMRDFADDTVSLIEWIYSQLPPSASLKELIIECLNGDKKSLTTKMIEIQPYNFEFRYIVFLQSETQQV